MIYGLFNTMLPHFGNDDAVPEQGHCHCSYYHVIATFLRLLHISQQSMQNFLNGRAEKFV
jgi:hypothetical protein